MPDRTLIFAGGGTGGHIYPALAIAEHALALDPGVRARFLCSDRAIDARILETATLAGASPTFTATPARPVGLRPRSLASFLASWGRSVRACREAIRTERREGREPLLIAMGGFVAAPATQSARAERVPAILVNLDATPGKANRWVARRCERVLTALPIPDGALRTRGEARVALTGPIVRSAAVAPPPPSNPRTCREQLALDPDRTTLMVTGGSQGAASVNAFALALVREHPAPFEHAQVLHQAGRTPGEAARVEQAYRELGVRAIVVDLVDRIGLWWGAADWAIGRAGAGTVMEAWANRVPSVFLPYPWHRDQHQRRNAEGLERAGGCVIIEDKKDAQATLDASWDAVRSVATDASTRESMRGALAGLGVADGARAAAEAILA